MIRDRLKASWAWLTRPRIVSVTIQYAGDIDALVRRYDEIYTRRGGMSKQKAKTKEQAMSQLQSEMRPLQRSKEEGYQQRQAETQAFQSEMHRKLTEIAQGMDEDMSQHRVHDVRSVCAPHEPALMQEMDALTTQVMKLMVALQAEYNKVLFNDARPGEGIADLINWQTVTVRGLRMAMEVANKEVEHLYELMGVQVDRY